MARKAIIFDLDGTLLNTLDDLHTCVNYVLELNNYPLRTKEEIRQFVGSGMRVLMKRALPKEFTEEEFEKHYQEFQSYYTANLQRYTAPYPGIIELLEELKRRQIALGVVSNKFQEGVTGLNNQFFKEYIDVAIGTQAGLKPKPAPDSLFLAISELNLNIEEDQIYYIGDSDVDILTGRNAKLPVISVTWGFRTEEELSKMAPDYLVATPKEILDIIDNSK